jgi:hypothetical protein
MGFAFVGLVCGCGGALLALLVAASLLRLAVSIANRLIGPVKEQAPASGGIAEWDWDDWDDEYTTSTKPARARPGANAIPEPGIPKCVAIILTTAFAAGLGFTFLGFAAEAVGLRMHRDDTKLAVALVDLPLTSFVLVLMLVAVLPTTFWRASMVTFLYNLIIIGLAVGIGTVVYAATVFV